MSPSDIRARLDKLRAQHRKGAPSLVPGKGGKPTQKPEEVIPDIRELGMDEGDTDTLMRLSAQHVMYAREESTAKRMKDGVTERIKSLCNDYSLTKAKADDLTISYYDIERTSLDPVLLRSYGVKAEVIVACTVTTRTKGLRISAPRQGQEDQ